MKMDNLLFNSIGCGSHFHCSLCPPRAWGLDLYQPVKLTDHVVLFISYMRSTLIDYINIQIMVSLKSMFFNNSAASR